MAAASYRDLKVWQESMSLAQRIYAATCEFPAEERYGLAQQMRRAAVSIPSNIAEGYGRRTARQRFNFLENALGSLFELETQTELSARLGFLRDTDATELAATIRGLGRGLTALMRYVQEQAREEKTRYT
ncbi:MAG TPA: four helix bundle protein [Thermoanaerobaculia bacterium]